MLRSVLDNDLYAFTMMQAFHQLYPWAEGEETLILRDPVVFTEDFMNFFECELTSFRNLRLKKDELEYLKSLKLFTPVFLDFLKNFEFDLDEVECYYRDGQLSLKITGPLFRIPLWEAALMAMISSLYFENYPHADYQRRFLNNITKVAEFDNNKVKFVEGGTRRRFSFKVQDEFVKEAKNSEYFLGTSNVYLAMKHRVPPVGTYSHRWVMYHGAMKSPLEADYEAMKAWDKIYDGKLAIALTDTYGTPLFLESFAYTTEMYNCNAPQLFSMYKGVRQDSGDPKMFGYDMIDFYKNQKEDPKEYTIVFSDSLTTDKAVDLNNTFKDKINCKFLIGTHFTNDVGVTPLNMVIKPSKFREHPNSPWKGAVKLSDVEGKHTGNPEDIGKYKTDIAQHFRSWSYLDD